MARVISPKEFATQLAKLSRPRLTTPYRRPLLDPPLIPSLPHAAPCPNDNIIIQSQPQRIGIAVSGGVDSMALVTLLARHYRSVDPVIPSAGVVGSTLSKESAPPVQLHGFIVDHKLRDESTTESELVAQEIAKQGVIPHILTLNWSSAQYSNQQQGQHQDQKPEKHHLETQARLERYRVIAQQCHALQIQDLFVGHHSGDQVETVLFRLARASGIDGLSGIQSSAPFGVMNVPEALDLKVLRPLLDFDKKRLRATCQELGVQWVEDPSNRSLDYQRNVIRFFQQKQDESNDHSPLSTKALLDFRRRMDRHRRIAWNQVTPWLRDIQFDPSNGVCHFELQARRPAESSDGQGITESGSTGTPSLEGGWLKESETHVATRLVSFLVRWVGCRDHPPGLEDIQLMLTQLRLQTKAVLEPVGQVKDEEDVTRSENKAVYRKQKTKNRVSNHTRVGSRQKPASDYMDVTSRTATTIRQQQSIQLAGVLFSPPRRSKGLLNHWTLSRQPFSQADQISTQIRLNMLSITDKTLLDTSVDVLWDRRFFLKINQPISTEQHSRGGEVGEKDAVVVRNLTQQDVHILRQGPPPETLTELESFMTNMPAKSRFTIPVVALQQQQPSLSGKVVSTETLVSIPTLNIHLLPELFKVQSRFKSERAMDVDLSID